MGFSVRSSFVFSCVVAAMLFGSGCADVEGEDLDSSTSSIRGKGKQRPAPPPTNPADIPPDCVGYFEREPDPRRGGEKLQGGKVCGELSPGDVDTFEFDVREKNKTFMVRLEAEDFAQIRVHSTCSGHQVAEGRLVELRVRPNDNCTVRVNVTSASAERQMYRLFKRE